MELSGPVALRDKNSGAYTVAIYDGSHRFRPISVTPTQELHDHSKIMQQQGSLTRGSSQQSYSQQRQYSSANSTLERSHQHMLQQARGQGVSYRQQTMSNGGGTEMISERTPVNYRQEKIVYENSPKISEYISERHEPYRPPSVGLFTQMDAPQPVVAENEPVTKPVDARYGYHTEYISSNVRNLRENFREPPDNTPEVHRTGRSWQQAEGIPWEPLPGKDGGPPQPSRDRPSRSVTHIRTFSTEVTAEQLAMEAEKTAYLHQQIQMQRERSRTPTKRYPIASYDGPVPTPPLLPGSPLALPPPGPSKAVSSTNAAAQLPPLPPPKAPVNTAVSQQISEEVQRQEVFQQESRKLLEEKERMDQEQLYEQYQREEHLRQEKLRKEQNKLLARQRKEEAEIRARQEREKRQAILKQQELEQQQKVQQAKMEEQRELRKREEEHHRYIQTQNYEQQSRQQQNQHYEQHSRQQLQNYQQQQEQQSRQQINILQTNLEQQRQAFRREQESKMLNPYPDQNQEPALSPGGTSWKRTYIVAPREDVVKNEIKISDELLKDESYYIDLLSRRDAFIEKPNPPPKIDRVGKVWEPPPERPSQFPLRNPHKEFVPVDDKEYKWEPYLLEPEFKYERKNFTPEPSPPPRRRSMRQQPPSLAQNTSIPLPPLQIRDHTPIPMRQPVPRGDPPLDVRMRVIQRPPSVTPSETSSLSAMYTSEPNLPHRVIQTPSASMEPSPRGFQRRAVSYDPNQVDQYNMYGPLNEPTSRHPSTITVPERPPSVNITKRINVFERVEPIRGGDSARGTPTPRRGFGENSRPSATSSLSLDDDVFDGNRAVRFAERSNVIPRGPKGSRPKDNYRGLPGVLPPTRPAATQHMSPRPAPYFR